MERNTILCVQSNLCVSYINEYFQNHGLSDVGGPATHKDLLVGIVTYGASSEKEPYVAIFTNMSYFYQYLLLVLSSSLYHFSNLIRVGAMSFTISVIDLQIVF